MCVLIFFTAYVQNVSHSKKNYAKYDHKLYSCPYKVPVIPARF